MAIAPFQVEVVGTHRGEVVHKTFQSLLWNVWPNNKKFPPLLNDLYRIASTVYFLARMFVRNKKTWNRDFQCSIEVYDPAFWSTPSLSDQLTCILSFISGDNWKFRFTKGNDIQEVAHLEFESSPTDVFCLYSGGLDSMAGLVKRLNDCPEKSFIPITVCHRTDIRRATSSQLDSLSRLYPNIRNGKQLFFPFRMERQFDFFEDKRESTQRTRAFLFMIAGGIAALKYGNDLLEVYEAGIGTINAPLLPDMTGTMTRSTHPEFLKKTAELLSQVAGKDFNILLPHSNITKSELVCSLNNNPELKKLALESFSCVCYPRRNTEKKICGKCFACIFRRIALFNAGITENLENYEFDILSNDDWSRMKQEERRPLCVFFEQIHELSITTKNDSLPQWIEKHIRETNATMGRPMKSIVDLYRRYALECSRFVEQAAKNGCKWAV